MTPVMLAEYVPADFDAQQRQTAEEAVAKLARESGLDATRLTTVVRQGGIYHEVLEEAELLGADLIVMVSHRPALKTYFLGSNAGHVVPLCQMLRAGGAREARRRITAAPVPASGRARRCRACCGGKMCRSARGKKPSISAINAVALPFAALHGAERK